jgi:hypothetical protein
MKHLVICLVALTGFLFLATAAQAQMASTPYTYFEGAFQGSSWSTDGVLPEDIDGHGPRFKVSFAMHENVYLFGSYEKNNLDDYVDTTFTPPTTISFADIDTFSIGGGINTALTGGRVDRNYRGFSDRFSVFLDAQYLNGGPTDDNGYAMDIGFRAINNTRLEFIASAGLEKFSGISNEFALEGRLLYRLVGNLQIQGGIDWTDPVTKYFIGLRWGIPKFAVFKDRK